MTDNERFGEYQSTEPQGGGGVGLGITMLLIGLGAGALTALLLAPRSGRQTRRMLRRKYEDAVDNFSERGAGWAETARGWVGAAKDAAENASEKIKPVVKEVRRRVEK